MTEVAFTCRRAGYALRVTPLLGGAWQFDLRRSNAKAGVRRIERLCHDSARRLAAAVLAAPEIVRAGMGGWRVVSSRDLEPPQFTPALASIAKDTVRQQAYSLVRSVLAADGRTARSVLMLPGHSPQSEIDCIKAALGRRTRITAYDRDAAALAAARAAGASEVMQGYLRSANDRYGAFGSIRGRQFSLVNIDLCQTLETPATLDIVRSLSYRADHAFMVWVSYGHDKAAVKFACAREKRITGDGAPTRNGVPYLGRALLIEDATNGGLAPRWKVNRVWRYVRKAGGLPMLCVLMLRSTGREPAIPDVVHVTTDGDVREGTYRARRRDRSRAVAATGVMAGTTAWPTHPTIASDDRSQGCG